MWTKGNCSVAAILVVGIVCNKTQAEQPLTAQELAWLPGERTLELGMRLAAAGQYVLAKDALEQCCLQIPDQDGKWGLGRVRTIPNKVGPPTKFLLFDPDEEFDWDIVRTTTKAHCLLRVYLLARLSSSAPLEEGRLIFSPGNAADKLMEIQPHDNGVYLAARAAAYAVHEDYRRAAQLQRQAIEKLVDVRLRQEFERRANLFSSRKLLICGNADRAFLKLSDKDHGIQYVGYLLKKGAGELTMRQRDGDSMTVSMEELDPQDRKKVLELTSGLTASGRQLYDDCDHLAKMFMRYCQASQQELAQIENEWKSRGEPSQILRDFAQLAKDGLVDCKAVSWVRTDN